MESQHQPQDDTEPYRKPGMSETLQEAMDRGVTPSEYLFEDRQPVDESNTTHTVGELMPGVIDKIHERSQPLDLIRVRRELINLQDDVQADPKAVQALEDEIIRLENEARENPRPGE